MDRHKLKLFYISTDYVFAGEGEGMNKPEDAVNPQGVYALSKYALTPLPPRPLGTYKSVKARF